MSLPQLKPTHYTLEELMTWDGRWELINGVVFDMTPAPNLEHQRISSELHLAIGNALADIKRTSGGGTCEVFAAPIDVFLHHEQVVQPDLVIVCDPEKKTKRGIEGPPDLVVEILSPSTVFKDMSRKRWAYEAAGVPEYLIINPDERFGILLRLEAGRYIESEVAWNSVIALLGGRINITLCSSDEQPS